MKKGIIALIIVGVIYNEVQKKRKQAPVFYVNKLPKNYNAQTIPPFGIFIKETEKQNLELLQHEKIHWQQYQNNGLVKFYFDYSQQANKFGYDKMPMEIAARKNETEYCKTHYTECVRNGTSNTIYNPQFRN